MVMAVLGWAVVLVLVVLGGNWCLQNIQLKPRNKDNEPK